MHNFFKNSRPAQFKLTLFKGQIYNCEVSHSYTQHLLRTYYIQVTKLSPERRMDKTQSLPSKNPTERQACKQKSDSTTFDLPFGN